MEIKRDMQVRCLRNSIDKQKGEGLIGRVDGFARFSAYHAREVYVDFGDLHPASGWFWITDVEPVSELNR